MKYQRIPDSEDIKMQKISNKLNIKYVSLVDLMCKDTQCVLYDNNNDPIQWDNGHLTPTGSMQLMDLAAARGELPM